MTIGPLDGGVEASPMIVSGGLVLVPDSCVTGSCPVTLWVGIGLGPFDFRGKNVTNAGLTSVTPLSGILDSSGTLTIPAATFRVSGAIDHLGAAFDFQNAFPLNAVINPGAGTVDFELSLADEDKLLRAQVHAFFARTPPVARITGLTSYECTSPGGAHVSLSGATSTDREGPGDLAHFFWYRSDIAEFDAVHDGVDYADRFPLGSREVRLRVIDSLAKEGAASTIVTVVDTTPPVLAAQIATPCVWPANHGAVLFKLGRDLLVDAFDACSSLSADVRIIDVSSTEAALELGSGHTSNDVAFGSGAFCLRAERSGGAAGRTYRVTVQATDPSGNAGTAVVEVKVPHDARPGRRCDDVIPADRLVELTDPRCTADVSLASPVTAKRQGGSPTPTQSGCSTTGTLEVLSLLLGALLLQRPWRRTTSLVLIVAVVGTEGCTPAAVDRSCVVGVWLGPASSCSIPCAQVTTGATECSASDCQVTPFLVLAADGTSTTGSLTHSPSERRYSKWGEVVRSRWILNGNQLTRIENAKPQLATCTESGLTMDGQVLRRSAPELGAKLSSSATSGTWSQVSY